MKAIWNNVIIAESNDTVVVDNNHYFPPESVNFDYFTPSDHKTTCSWKGEAHYYDITVSGQTNQEAAWYYPEPLEKAEPIKGYVAFWRGVDIED